MKRKYLLTIGQLSLVASILLMQFAEQKGVVPFIIGLLTGLAIVCNTAYLLRRRINNL